MSSIGRNRDREIADGEELSKLRVARWTAFILVPSVYMIAYFSLVVREQGFVWSVGPANSVVFPSYRVCYRACKVIFWPAEYIDIQYLRRSYWTPDGSES